MADEVDLGNEFAMELVSSRLHEIQHQLATREAEPAGHCLNPLCEDEFTEGDPRLYCNADCANEHARFKQLAGRSYAG